MRSKASQRKPSDFNGIVLWAAGGVYRVLLDTNQQVDAALRGRLKLEQRTGDRVVAGDRVRVELHDDRSYAIEAVAERKSELARRAPGRGEHQRAKIVVANVDQVVIMVAAARPAPRLRMIDRFLVLAEANDLPSLLVVNKVDLTDEGGAGALFRDYAAAGYEVLLTSAKEKVGIAELSARVCGRESVIAGPSGVGKSSILNLLQPGIALRTAEISAAVVKGRHTTVAAQLIPLGCGGYVVDTPGIREVGLFEINPESLDVCFPELRPLLGDCRFTMCTHTHEPGCAILDAVESGVLSRARYESYRDLYLEARS
ncbi:MAG: ribosome small subunit-dependent GTPase A [Gemmatimonadota bacterium]